MKNRKIINGIIKLIIFLLILFMCLMKINDVLKRKISYEKIDDFFKQKEDYDVLFFGSSHVGDGIDPMRLWKEQGIVSYNLGSGGELLPLTYHDIKLATKYTKPDLVVVDVYHMFKDGKYEKDDVKCAHNALDMYPISYEKYLAVKDIFGDENIMENMAEYLFNFSIYHARWSEVSKEDFKLEHNMIRGLNQRYNVNWPLEKYSDDFYEINEVNIEDRDGAIYFRKIIEYCKENNIEILAIDLPFIAFEKDRQVAEYVQKVCDEYNINFLNFLDLNIADFYTDFDDEGFHLNVSGTRKVTDYLGNYIMENYDIQDQRNNDAYSFWNKDYDRYIELKINKLEVHKEDTVGYLMLLANEKDIAYEVKVKNEKVIKSAGKIEKLFQNLENNYEIDEEAFKEKEGANMKITTWDNRNGCELQTVWF